MEGENNLDSFVGVPNQNASSTATSSVDNAPVFQRPKLKKIKRAKVRPVSDNPAIPEKIMPNISTSAEETCIVENNPTSRQNAQTETVEPYNNAAQEQQIGTELITAVDAQDLSNANEVANSSYVLDNLPPELEEDDEFDTEFPENGYIKKKIMYIATALCFLIGIIIGKVFFASQTIENYGLEGVVTNPDVPSGRPRCGLTDKSQACIFYVMNWYKQELNGRDFYKLAAQLTGREEYMIETDNLRYANVKIKPGHFAQLNIPAIK